MPVLHSVLQDQRFLSVKESTTRCFQQGEGPSRGNCVAGELPCPLDHGDCGQDGGEAGHLRPAQTATEKKRSEGGPQ